MTGEYGEWLQSLQVLLATLEPRGLALLEGEFCGDDIVRVESVPSHSRVLEATEGFRPGAAWLVCLPCNESSIRHALLIDGGDSLEATTALVVMARLLCRAAWRVRHPPGNLLAAGDESRQALHDLRNGLNSVVMSSAVIGGAVLPEELRGFVHDLENAGRRSLRSLMELSALLASR